MCRAVQFAQLGAGHGARALAWQVGVRRAAVQMIRKAPHAARCAPSAGASQGQRAWARRATFLSHLLRTFNVHKLYVHKAVV